MMEVVGQLLFSLLWIKLVTSPIFVLKWWVFLILLEV